MNEIQENGIKIYTGETEEDEEDNPDIKELKVQCTAEKKTPSLSLTLSPSLLPHFSLTVCRFFLQEIIPFAVVGSNTLLEVNGKRVRGRLYPWGVVEG